MQYFRVFANLETGSWQLGMPRTESGKPVDCSLFFRPELLPYNQLTVPIEVEGNSTDFTIAPIEIPVLSTRCAKLLEAVVRHRLHFVDAILSNGECVKILHVGVTCDCIDYARSNIVVYPNSYPIKERIGKPQYIMKMVIDPEKAGTLDIFRVKNYEAALIMSERLHNALQDSNYGGYSVLFDV